MRILCLHGYGMNADVMKRQMAVLLKFCDPSWDFIFLEATIECPPAPRARAVSAGPFLCWSRDLHPASMKSAYASVDEVFKQRGPFDGTFCFSLGVTVMVGYLLQHVILHPNTPLPVKFGIFCSAVPILSSDPEYCHSIFGSLPPEDLQRLKSTEDDCIAEISEPARTAVQALLKVTDIMEPIIRLTRKDLLHRPLLEIPCPLDPNLFKARLYIPTLHVRAKNDALSLRESSDLAGSFCESKWRRMYEHSAVHNLPRSPAEAQEMAAAMEWVISKSQMSKL